MPHRVSEEVDICGPELAQRLHMARHDERVAAAGPSANGRGTGSKSYVNLTNSALQGVFGSQVSLAELTGDVSQPPTRPGTPGPSLRPQDPRVTAAGATASNGSRSPIPVAAGSAKRFSVLAALRGVIVLFLFGVAYGQLSKRLHDNNDVSTWTLDIDHTGVLSLLSGSQGIVLGAILPLFDYLYPERGRVLKRGKGGADWSSIVRASAAFLGIAYGIRKLAWASTSQAAFYWGMVNPCLWYILDATRNGFIVGTLTGLVGTTVFALVFPDHLPTPAPSEAYLSVVAWVASVFFCCSIGFGNLGRRLLVVDAKDDD